MKRVHADALAEACRLYVEEGLSAEACAARVGGISDKTVLRELNRLGLSRPSRNSQHPILPKEREPEIVEAYRGGLGIVVLKTRFHIGTTRLKEILARAGIVVGDGRGRAASHIATVKRANGKLVKATARLNGVAPTDPDARVLMRLYAPVCRAQVVDPKAPPDQWIVGTKRIPEQEMREMARRLA